MNREAGPPLASEGHPSIDAMLPKVCPSCGTRYTADALFCSLDGSPLATSPAAIAAAAATDPYIGHEIVGPIEIRQLVGIGAMGRVYRGFQKGIDRDVAVKILHRELSANPTVVARFHREAKVASRLAHPNVVHVLLTGQLPDGAMYIVMEYLDGLSLQSALAASGGSMPLSRALHIAMQLCDAVGEAHAQGIVHRDLKPENVMLVRRADDPDFVKVLDFGIARLNWGDQSMATAAGLIFGTARYISPEGAQGEKVAPPGDVYSIAMMFYQMLSGRTAFEADQAVALLVQQIHDPPPPLKSAPRASYVPEAIAAAVMRNLAKKPEERAANGRAFGRALLEAAIASGLSPQEILARRPLGGGPSETSQGGGAASVSTRRPGATQATPLAGARAEGSVARTVYDAPAEAAATATAPRAQVLTERATPDLRPQERATPSPSGVDSTMNEQQQPRAPAVSSQPAAFEGSGLRRIDGASGSFAARSTPEDAPTAPPWQSRRSDAAGGRTMTIVVGCFFLGVAAMAVAHSAGLLGTRRAGAPSLEVVTARANEALLHQRWEAPQGDNVRDITDEGLARFPHDPQLVRLRALACTDIVRAARQKRDSGSAAEALHLAKLAYELDPSDDLAQKLVAELESQAQAPPTDLVPPLAAATAPRGSPAPAGANLASPAGAAGQAVRVPPVSAAASKATPAPAGANVGSPAAPASAGSAGAEPAPGPAPASSAKWM